MVTIVNQTPVSTVTAVEFSFPVNCKHTKYEIIETDLEPNTVAFNSLLEQKRLEYETNFKDSPDYFVKDTNVNRGTIELLTFENGIGTAKIEFDVLNAQVSSYQTYSFEASLSDQEKQASLIEQVNQYEINYKIGNNLTDL